MQSLQHSYAVHRDGHIETGSDLTPAARAILERMSRISYVIDMHRQGIALQSRRLAELRAELETIEGRS